jgi:hypothetical protein
VSGQRAFEEVHADAVRVLTEAARATRTRTDRDGPMRHEPADFAEFVTHALTGAAANIGSVDQLLAGRPGSWEADHIRQLLASTVGYYEEYLLDYRTEPVTVVVAVDDLLTDLGVSDLFDQAHDELYRREDAILVAAQRDGQLLVIEDLPVHQKAALADIDRLREALERLRTEDWAGYADSFTTNVHCAAHELLPGLRVPVTVEVHLDWHHDDNDDESLGGPADRLWQHAYERTPLPGSGIPPSQYPPGVHIAQVERDAGRDPLSRLQHHDPAADRARPTLRSV